MYSGLELTRYSGRLIGAHQKIDQVARRHLKELLAPQASFPGIRAILHFEGRNGPDGIKLKSPSKNEPWHFFDPLKDEDSKEFLKLIRVHYNGLVKELKAGDHTRSAFEASWLAHAVVDGLTPAHHYPFEAKLAELRSEAPPSAHTTYKKVLFSGRTKRKTLKNIVKAYGPRGLYMGHWVFEWGFSAIIKPLRFPDARPSPQDIARLKKIGYEVYFQHAAVQVAQWHMFEEYLSRGWNSRLARQARQDLAPLMIRVVTLLWYSAAMEAET